MEHVQEAGEVDIQMAEQNIRKYINLALESSDALMLTSHLNLKHRSIWQHSMNVTVLAIQLGQYLNFNEKQLIIIGLCGLFHDIGSLLISKEMFDEHHNRIELMRSHTILGRDILLSCESPWSETVAEVAYSHHEHLNGSGFPRGLSGDQISTYTRMISIIDIYDNLTNTVSTKQPLTHYQAIEKLQTHQDTHLDADLIESFNQCLSTYPVGTMLELNTGEIAVVVEENPQHKLKPKIRLLSKTGNVIPSKKIIDLADDSFQSADCLYEIKAIYHAK